MFRRWRLREPCSHMHASTRHHYAFAIPGWIDTQSHAVPGDNQRALDDLMAQGCASTPKGLLPS